jgi:hypothetical protein
VPGLIAVIAGDGDRARLEAGARQGLSGRVILRSVPERLLVPSTRHLFVLISDRGLDAAKDAMVALEAAACGKG